MLLIPLPLAFSLPRDPVTGLGSLDYPHFFAAFVGLQAPFSGAAGAAASVGNPAGPPLGFGTGKVAGSPGTGGAWVWVAVAVGVLAAAVVVRAVLLAKDRGGGRGRGCALLGGAPWWSNSRSYAPAAGAAVEEEGAGVGAEEGEGAPPKPSTQPGRPGLLGVAVTAGLAGSAAPREGYGSVGMRAQPVQPPQRPAGRW